MQKADKMLISNGVFTGLTEKPEPGAVAIKGNRILAVGGKTEMEAYMGPETSVLDFGEKMIMPGFVDAHVHFFLGAFAASKHMNTDIDKSTSEAECIRMMIEYSRQNPDEPRICGMGWFPANWHDAPLPTKDSLDAAFPDKPAYLICADAHTAWLNTKALEECGITPETTIEAGEICKDEQGNLTGILTETACFMAFGKMLNLPTETIKEMQKSFLNEAASFGVTCISDMSAYELNEDTIGLFEAGRELEQDESLPVRLHFYPALGTEPNYGPILEYKRQFDTEKVKISGLKGFVDGVTSTYTGFLLEPYSDKPDTKGSPNYSPEVYFKTVAAANKEGLGVRLHCIADGSVRLALDCFSKSNLDNDNPGNRRKIRNSIEHCENVHPDDIKRFGEEGVIASMQPYHLTLDNNEKISRFGLERSKFEWPHRSLLDTGAILAFGTDYPVVGFNPFPSLYAAVTRKDDNGVPTGVNPEQCITLTEALKAYTIGGAYAYGRDEELGTLEHGKLADIVVVDNNLFKIDEKDIGKCRVDMTIMDGTIVYERR